jgi:hypothetical protein
VPVAVVQLFFDNERVNCTEVSRLGVVCIYTPHGVSSHSKIGPTVRACDYQGYLQRHMQRGSPLQARLVRDISHQISCPILSILPVCMNMSIDDPGCLCLFPSCVSHCVGGG